jgi:AcrR family transcriptional regulator
LPLVPRAGLTRDRVIDEAQQLSDEVGPGGMTLAALAVRLGVRQPSLYKHIAGSEDLHRALSIRAKEELAAVLARAAVGRSGDEAVAALAAAYRRWAHAHPGRYDATVRAPAPGDVEDQAASLAAVSVLTDVLAGYGIVGEPAIHATRGVRAALHGFVSIESAGGFGMPIDVDASFAHLVTSITTGLSGSVPAGLGTAHV